MKIESDYPINEEALINLKKLTEEYDILNSLEIQQSNANHKIHLKDSTEKKCRFCSKKYTEVNFKSISHTIPEFIGNKTLISEFECDNCNKYFSKFENEFANFMLPLNIFTNVKNKNNKHPKYKNKLEIYTNSENILKIKNFPDELLKNKNDFSFPLEIPSYIPDYIYRCLIKIGISLIPEEKNNINSEILDWLMDLEKNTIFPSSMLLSIFPFKNQIDKVRVLVLERKHITKRFIPKNIIILSYKNFAIQTFFPISSNENFPELLAYPYIIPTTLDLNKTLIDKKEINLVELQDKTRIKAKKIDFHIKNLE